MRCLFYNILIGGNLGSCLLEHTVPVYQEGISFHSFWDGNNLLSKSACYIINSLNQANPAK